LDKPSASGYLASQAAELSGQLTIFSKQLDKGEKIMIDWRLIIG